MNDDNEVKEEVDAQVKKEKAEEVEERRRWRRKSLLSLEHDPYGEVGLGCK